MFDGGIVSRNTVENIKNIIPAIEVDVESPARGMAEMIVESFGLEDAYNVNMGTWDDKKFIVNCPGVGGAEIEALLGESYYQYVRNAIQGAKNICDKNGWELDIPLWCWVQGEQNIKNKTTTNTYKELLTQLHNKFCQDVYDITGISTRPKCVLYQPNDQNLFSLDFGYGNEYMGVPTAFVELLMDSDDFIASTPTYIFDHADKNGYWVHLNAESYKLLGAYLGYSIKKYMSDNVVNKGVIPLNVNIEGNNVSIKYNVPCPPLSIDTNYVNKIKNYGFSIIDSNNIELIEDVIVFNDTVTLKCSSSPKGAKLRYGLNGDSHKGGSDNPYLSIAGRMYGARGNLRDNQGSYIYKDINGRKLPLYNWAYTFEKLL